MLDCDASHDYDSCLYRARFLTHKERAEVQRRLEVDHGHLSNDFDMKYVWQAIGDWKIYIFMLICMAGFCPIYSFALFLPTIIKVFLNLTLCLARRSRLVS